MKLGTCSALLFGILATVAHDCRADILLGDYTADFSHPTPAAGWSYWWNEDGAIGNPGNYNPLVADGGALNHYGPVANGGWPDPGAGAYTIVAAGFMHPGQGSAQAGFEHFAIAAFTLSTSGQTFLTNIAVADTDNGADGITIFWNVDGQPGFTNTVPNLGSFSLASFDFGILSAGQTIYFGIGSQGTDGNDSTNVQFQITQVPEPSTWALAGLSTLGMGSWLRRRRTLRLTRLTQTDTI